MYFTTSTFKTGSVRALQVSGLALIVSVSLGATGALAQAQKPAAASKPQAPALCPITPPGAKSPASCPAKPQVQSLAPAATAPMLAAAKPFAHRPLHARTPPSATAPIAPPPVLAVRPEPLPELPAAPVPYLSLTATEAPAAVAIDEKSQPGGLASVPLSLTPLAVESAPAKTQAQGQNQAQAQATPLQTRGLSTGQDVASLGLGNERGFSVKGLGGGQNLSALDVNMPTLIHQILANDEARVAVTTATPPPPEETTPEFMERTSLSRQLMRVDGSEDLIRHLVNKVHMKLIVNEVNKYLNINSLPESERYRLSAIVATTASELSERILNLNARAQARMLNKAELTQLIGTLDVESQRKLTRMRLEDDGALDKQAELEIQLAQLNIIKAYERK